MVDRSWLISCSVSRSKWTSCVPSMKGSFVQPLFSFSTSMLSMVTSSFDSWTGASLIETIKVPNIVVFCESGLLGSGIPDAKTAAMIIIAAAMPANT